MSFQAGAARADDTAAEIRVLKERLRQLEQRVAEQSRKEKETQAQLQHAAAQPGPAPAPYAYPLGPGAGLGLPEQHEYANPLVERLAKIKGYPYVGSSSLYLGGMSITPGGFIELGSVTRDHFIGADLATPFGNIPFAFVPSSHSAEFRFTARRSRFSFLTLGDVDPTHLSGLASLISSAPRRRQYQREQFVQSPSVSSTWSRITTTLAPISSPVRPGPWRP